MDNLYQKQNFTSGQVLTASMLNRMDSGIVANQPLKIFDWINVDAGAIPDSAVSRNDLERNVSAYETFVANPARSMIIGLLNSGRHLVGYMPVIYAYLDSNQRLIGRALNYDGSLSSFAIDPNGEIEYFGLVGSRNDPL